MYVKTSKSGKVNKNILKDWFNNVYFEKVSDRSLLLVDSWNGHDFVGTEMKLPEKKSLKVLRIPEHANSLVQLI